MDRIDPMNDPDNSDFSEVETCRHCRELIRPGTEDYWNGWAWHPQCVPPHVTEGREDEARLDRHRDEVWLLNTLTRVADKGE